MTMCSLVGSSYYRPFGLRSDAVSPQAADVIDNGLNTHDREIGKKFENKFTPEKRMQNGDDDLVRKQGKEDIEAEALREKYQNYIRSNSSDIESDPERDELNLSKQAEGYDKRNRNFGFTQHLPSNINPYASAFGAEEARLRFNLESAQFKERLGSIGISPFGDEAIHRRYSLQETVPESSKLTSQSSSPPLSPRSQSLQSSPLPSYNGQGHGPRSVHDLSFEEQDSNSFLPRIKEGLFFCHLCSFSGTTQGDFDQHMTVHFEHICPHCDYKSRTEGRLKRHIKDFHTEDPDGGYNRTMPGRPKVFRCKQCEYSTTDKIEFWTHSRSHIKEDKLLQCPRCPFVTEYKHHLEYHLRNHFGSKPFKCPKCNYACVNKSMLNSHMKSHTNVYQYRCADCTYATKYCHSLKLHLRKYNHKPAAVLNSDGSLPQGVDATASGLSLMAKRGPPRGPRGPRKDKMDQSPGSFLPMPPTSMAPLPGLPGMVSPFWPLMQGQMPGRLPHPLSLGPRFNPQFARFPNFGIKSEEMKSPPSSSNSDPFKCNFCSFVGTSREILTSHVVKVHASENQDLFSMFGLSSESLLEDNQKRMNALSSFRSPLKSPRIDAFSPGMELNLNGKKESDGMQKVKREKEEALNMSPFAFMNGKFHGGVQGAGHVKDEGIDILKQMTLKFGSGPVDLKRKLPVDPVPVSSEGPASDSPLDLTKPRSSPPVYQQEGSYKHDDAEGEHSSGENSVYSNEVMSPTPRKRSRKGKAFKLDTLCMKLQEKQGNMYESDDDSAAEMDEMYTSDLLPVEADGQSPEGYSGNDNSYAENDSDNEKREMENGEERDNAETNEMAEVDPVFSETGDETDNKSTAEGEDINVDSSEKLPEEDLKQIHASLEMLNEKSSLKEDNAEVNEKAVVDNGKPSDGDAEKIDEDFKKSPSPPGFQSHNRRKPVAAAIQRGADIAWKILNDPKMADPARLIKNGDNGHKLELSPLDKKLWLDAPYCTKSQKGDYECPHCQISFGDCIMYTMHMGYHGYKDPYKCNMCGDTCKDRVEFFLHIARAAHN
ncbi:uncharacterized protein LOC123541329 isoform X3 [Mercenaria mercenaria]|uniref:uncharacterized protein LOC123541329 isoform X3 n=1 Tax=Mercenaria mercenaria TaxID=6596 RepID=UPI00234F2E9A|nr:uncharacterized protein LOC123541329 isoform X3 [Mercenaria mercenaria]XP_053382638.1 uncharacterized protein LOC123541329 isoform X3 [Mercenaria mercenaria]